MSENITGAAIPDDVMRKAVEAINGMYWEDEVQCIDTLNTAMNILTPAIERNLIERLGECMTLGSYYSNENNEPLYSWMDIEEWFRSQLPIEDEEVKK